jgi:hypothetical protein
VTPPPQQTPPQACATSTRYDNLDRLLGADLMSPIHKVTFRRLDSPLDVVANRTRRNLRLKRDVQILPPLGPFAGAEEVKALTGIITERRRNQQQRGQSEEKKAFTISSICSRRFRK